MKLIGYLLVAAILLAILRLALAVIVAVYLLTLVICAAIRPKETFGFFAYMLACFLLTNHTIAALGTILSCVIVGAVAKSRTS